MIQQFLKYKTAAAVFYLACFGIFIATKPLITNMEDAGIISWISLILLVVIWIIVLVDMIKSSIYSKTFWILAMFIMPYFAPAFYFFQRKTIKHIENNKFKNS